MGAVLEAPIAALVLGERLKLEGKAACACACALESGPLSFLATCSSRLSKAVDIHISWSMGHEVALYQQLGLGTGQEDTHWLPGSLIQSSSATGLPSAPSGRPCTQRYLETPGLAESLPTLVLRFIILAPQRRALPDVGFLFCFNYCIFCLFVFQDRV